MKVQGVRGEEAVQRRVLSAEIEIMAYRVHIKVYLSRRRAWRSARRS